MIHKKNLLWVLVWWVLLTWLAWAWNSGTDTVTGSIDNGNINQWLEVSLPCTPASVSNGTVNATTCAITCNANYDKSWTSCVPRQSWWGGGWSYTPTPTCTLANLVCGAGKYELKSWASCQWWSLGNACTVSTGTQSSWSVSSGSNWSGSTVWSPFTPEFNQAYQFAFDHGITTMPTIEEANMTGTLIRSHMAKMITNYAIKVLGKTLDTWAVCVFDDIANETPELQMYIKLSCQLWLMGINITSFSPNTEVTRAEFGTVLSRTIYGTLYNGGVPYYLNHLKALQDHSIITDTNPDLQELRAYVMLMLMRAAE